VIEQCLASINDQTYAAQNVVVCDGGSSDATIDIATSCGATVVRSLASRSAQRNAGALRALGEYVVFIDSDMKLTRTVLEDCVKTFTERDAALVIQKLTSERATGHGSGDSNAPFTRASGGFRAPDVSGQHSF